MNRQVKISIQRWEPLGDGRVKVKIAEKRFHITDLTHEGIPYITLKQYGRGRYVVRRDPSWVAPKPAPVVPKGMVKIVRESKEDEG